MEYHSLPKHDKKRRKERHTTKDVLQRYTDPAYFEKWNRDTDVSSVAPAVVFSWHTFQSVFATPQVHPWTRDADPSEAHKALHQQLAFDLLDTTLVNVDFVMGILEVVYKRAFEGPTSSTIASPSLVHLFRTLVSNLGVWELPMGDQQWDTVVEDRLMRLVDDPDHLFSEHLSTNDLLFGHPSPLALARVFVSGVQFVHANRHLAKDKAPPKDVMQDFRRTFDRALEGIRHPGYSAQLLRFRALLSERPNRDLMWWVWHLVDVTECNSDLWSTLVEYAVAMNTTLLGTGGVGDDTTDPPAFARECNTVFDTSEEIEELGGDAIKEVRRQVKEGHAPRSVEVRTDPGDEREPASALEDSEDLDLDLDSGQLSESMPTSSV
jgi:hypothetical protein